VEMTSDTDRRITGVRQFVEKWRPTFREWLGPEAGDEYMDKYFADVIGRLAAQKLSSLALGDAYRATRTMFAESNYPLYTVRVLFRHVCIVGGSRVLPRPAKRVVRRVLFS
jgi:hypothetical protein